MTTNEKAARALPVQDARIYPRGGLDVLSRAEVARLRDASAGGMHELLRRCALAVLTSGSASDDPRAARDLYPDFDIQVAQQDRGVRIDLVNAPAMAFVDGEIIRGVAELLFAVVRDLAYMAIEMGPAYAAELESSEGITNAVFGLLRNARILNPGDPNLVVCWGGHSISRDEYLYTKQVGYEQDLLIGAGPAAPTAIEGDHLRRPADRQLRACIDEAQDGLTRRHLAITVGIGEGQHAARPAAVAAGAIAAAAHAAAAVAADRLAAGQAEQAQDFIVARGHPAGTQGALEARKRDRGQDRHHGDGDHQLDQREAAFPAQRHWTLPSVLMATMGHRPATGKRRQDERSIRDDGRQRLDDPPSPVRPGASPIAPAQAQASTW